MSIWLSNFVRVNGTKDGSSYATPGSYRLVLHTTETDGLGSMPTTHASPPQLWADLDQDEYFQGIPLDLAGYALKHPSGTVDTNRIPCVQDEIVGRADAVHTYSDDWYKKLALNVILPVCQAVSIDYRIFKSFKGEHDGVVLATASSPIRMSESEWKTFNGVCGHQHVPNNDHWDPGKLDYAKVLSFLP